MKIILFSANNHKFKLFLLKFYFTPFLFKKLQSVTNFTEVMLKIKVTMNMKSFSWGFDERICIVFILMGKKFFWRREKSFMKSQLLSSIDSLKIYLSSLLNFFKLFPSFKMIWHSWTAFILLIKSWIFEYHLKLSKTTLKNVFNKNFFPTISLP